MAKQELDRIRTARNFLRDFGRGKFRLLLTMLADNATDQEIADSYGVRAERAAEWRRTLGHLATGPAFGAHTTVEELFLQG
jgi:hypothetical protein